MKTITPQIRRASPALLGISPPPVLSSAPSPTRVEFQIAEMAFHGFSRNEAYRVSAEVRQELARLITADVAAARLREPLDALRVDAGVVQAAHRADATGRRLARAIYGGLPR